MRISDWGSYVCSSDHEESAAALRRFSAAANKATGASHPLDQRRWFDFIISAHRSGKDIGTDRLARWLHEVEGWDEDSAHRLAGEYERCQELLDREAETRGSMLPHHIPAMDSKVLQVLLNATCSLLATIPHPPPHNAPPVP